MLFIMLTKYFCDYSCIILKFSVLLVDYLVLESLMRHNLLQQHVQLPALTYM